MDERMYLRDLAKRQLEIARLHVMAEREERWRIHNAAKPGAAMIVVEESSFLHQIISPTLENAMLRRMEEQLQKNIAVHELIDDDKVAPDFFTVPVRIEGARFGLKVNRTTASDGLGYHDEPVLKDLDCDLDGLPFTEYSVDRDAMTEEFSLAEDILGDILPVRFVNTINHWHFGLTQTVVNLMGMEQMYCAMVESPGPFHRLMRLIVEDNIRLLRFQEEHGLLFANAGNDYMGGGSYCFHNELKQSGTAFSRETWGHLNSQETVGISPAMFSEMVWPYYMEMAREFGLIYYGCCEPVHGLWDHTISRLPNLRKVSVSPWCNETFMGERLAGSGVVYSRKPSPNFLGVQKEFDETAFRSYIRETAAAARGCVVEVIFRDIYDLHGDRNKLRRAVEIAREVFSER